MRKPVVLYLACVVLIAALAVGLGLVRLKPGNAGLMARLGCSEAEFQSVRDRIMLSAQDPTTDLLTVVTDVRRSERARVQALRVLTDFAAHRNASPGFGHLAGLLQDSPAALQVEILRTLATGTPEGTDVAALRSLFAKAADTATFNECYRALAAFSRKATDRYFDALDRKDTAAADSCRAFIEANPAARGAYCVRAARYFGERGDSARAMAALRSAGLIDSWWVVGGFDNTRRAGLDREYAPETTAFNPQTPVSLGDGSTEHWSAITHLDDEGFLRLSSIMTRTRCAVAYLRTTFAAPAPRTALLHFSSNVPVKFWLNDSLLLRAECYLDRSTLDDAVLRIRLPAGTSSLLVKSAQDEDGSYWILAVRLTDAEGNAMPDVGIAASPVAGTTDKR